MKKDKKEILNLDKIAEYIKLKESGIKANSTFSEQKILAQLSNFIVDFYQKRGVDLSAVTYREADEQFENEEELANYRHDEETNTGEIVYKQGMFNAMDPIENLLTFCHEYSHAYQYIGGKYEYDVMDYQAYVLNGGTNKAIYELLWGSNKIEFNADNMASVIVYNLIKELKQQNLLSNKEMVKIGAGFFKQASQKFGEHSLLTITRKFMPKRMKEKLDEISDMGYRFLIESTQAEAVKISFDIKLMCLENKTLEVGTALEGKIKEAENNWFDENIKNDISGPIVLDYLSRLNLEKISDNKLMRTIKSICENTVKKGVKKYMLYTNLLRQLLTGKSLSKEEEKTIRKEIEARINSIYQETINKVRATYNKDDILTV